MDTDKSPPVNVKTPSERPLCTHESDDDRSENGSLSTEEITCGCRCGSKCHVPCHCLQPLGNAKWSLVLISLGNLIQQILFNGILAVTISTLEKRFELRSTESGLIASMGDFGRGISMFLILFLSSRADKPRIIGWGNIIGGIAAICFALPHFIAPEYTPVVEDMANFCGNVTEPNCNQSPLRNYLYWFMVCFVVLGVGTCPLIIQGVTYLDENVPRKDSALYSAIFMAVGGLGPAIGFVFGGMALELYTYPSVKPDDVNIDSSSYSWVGAWWIGYLISGALLIMNGLPIILLPKVIPGTEKHRKGRDVETQKSHLENRERNNERATCGVFADILILLQNKPYIFQTLGITMNCALVYGFNTFGAKYLESVFGMTPFHSSLLYGIAAIFASFGAQLTSGVVLRKFNLQVRGIIKFMICTGVVSVLSSIGFLVHCEDIDFAGGTVPYPNTSDPTSLLSSCNVNCSCTTDRYEPVCANGITYFSPCFAGCEVKLNDTSYTDCSCVLNNASLVDREVIASTESCDWKLCNTIIPFTFIVMLCFYTSVLTMTPSLQVTMRCVPFDKRDMAVSFQSLIIRMVGIIPGRILVGYVLDKACVSSSTECGERGSCKVYDRWGVARNNTILLISQTVLCCIAYTLVLLTYKPAGETAAGTSKLDKSEHSPSGDNEETVKILNG